jgi:hypothetical protein
MALALPAGIRQLQHAIFAHLSLDLCSTVPPAGGEQTGAEQCGEDAEDKYALAVHS